MIERNTNGTFGEPISLELVFECLYHFSTIGIDTNVLFMSVKPKKRLAMIFERGHSVDDCFFGIGYGLLGKSANALKLFPFRGFNCGEIVVYYRHKMIIACEISSGLMCG